MTARRTAVKDAIGIARISSIERGRAAGADALLDAIVGTATAQIIDPNTGRPHRGMAPIGGDRRSPRLSVGDSHDTRYRR